MSLPIPHSSVREAFCLNAFNTCQMGPGRSMEAMRNANQVKAHEALLRQLERGGLPWWGIGCMDIMEAGSVDDSKHLANGQALTADTTMVPRHLMATYRPELKAPFSFMDAANAALDDFEKGWGKISITTLGGLLDFFCKWNGLGEWEFTSAPGLAYLFSGTDHYIRGKFQEEPGQPAFWNATLISGQLGIVPVMKALNITAATFSPAAETLPAASQSDAATPSESSKTTGRQRSVPSPS